MHFLPNWQEQKNYSEQIESGVSEAQIRQSWKKDLESFKKMRTKYLIYK